MSKMVKGISVITVVVFVLMVIAGTAAASGIMAPKLLAKVLEAAGQEIQVITAQAGGLYKGGVQQLANLFGGAATGDPPSGNHINTGLTVPGEVNQNLPRFTGARSQNPLFSRIPGTQNGAGGQSVASLIAGQSSPGSGGTGDTGGSGGGTGTGTGTGDSGNKPNDPAKTPIPGAVWLMGTGLIGIAASRLRKTKT